MLLFIEEVSWSVSKQYSEVAHGSSHARMVGGNGAKKCIWKPMKFITGNSRGNSWLPAKSNSVDTRRSEGPVTQDCPSAHRLVHPLALLPRRPHHTPLPPLPLLGVHCTPSLLLGSVGERGRTPGPWRAEPAAPSAPSSLSCSHPPSPIPCPKKASESWSRLFHPLLYSILSSAAGWDKTWHYE